MFSFEHVLILAFSNRIFLRIQITMKTLQRSDINLDDARNILHKNHKTVINLWIEFDYVDQTRKLSAKWNIDPSITSKHKSRVKTFYDKL